MILGMILMPRHKTAFFTEAIKSLSNSLMMMERGALRQQNHLKALWEISSVASARLIVLGCVRKLKNSSPRPIVTLVAAFVLSQRLCRLRLQNCILGKLLRCPFLTQINGFLNWTNISIPNNPKLHRGYLKKFVRG